MQVTETLCEGLKRSYAVVVEAAEIEPKVNQELTRIGRNIRWPGFRPGKVPAAMVRKRYGRDVTAQVLQTQLNETTDKVLADRSLRPAGRPRVGLTGELNISADKVPGLNFTIEMELLPDITVPDLTSLSLTRIHAEVEDDALDAGLTNLAKARAQKVAVTDDRAAVVGDVLTVDFAGTLDGVAFDGGTGTDADVELGGTGYIPGFAEGMEGMRAGESRDVSVTFPQNYHAANLAGKDAVFAVTAKALSTRETPELNDALAESMGLGTLDELKDFVRKTLQRELDQTARLRVKRELLDKLSELADFPTPSNLLDAEFGAIWQRIEADMKAGMLDEEDRGKDEATLRDEYRQIAERRVRLGLLLAEIGRVNSIDVTENELNMALRNEIMRYPGQEQQVLDFFRRNQGAVAQLRGPIFEDKVVDFILRIAKVEDKLVSVEELNKPMEGLPGSVDGAQTSSMDRLDALTAEGAMPEIAPETDEAVDEDATAAEQ